MSLKLKVILGFLFTFLILIYFSYPTIVRVVVVQQIEKVEKQWKGIIDYDSFEVSGLTVKFKNLYVSGNDTVNEPLFTAKKLVVSLSLWNLITRNPLPSSVILDSATVHIYKTDDERWNFSRGQIDSSASDSSNHFPTLIRKLFWVLDQPFENNLPLMIVSHVNFDFSFGRDHLKLANILFLSNSDSLKFSAIDGKGFLISLDGAFNSDSLVFNQYRPAELVVPLPGKDNLLVKNDSGLFIIKKSSEEQFSVRLNLNNFILKTSGLSDEPVVVSYLKNTTLLNFENDKTSLHVSNSTTVVKAEINSDYVFTETESLPKIDIHLSIPPVDSKTFHQSVPKSISGELDNFSFSGKLGYELSVSADFNMLDSLQLSGKVLKEKFWVGNPGVDFPKLDTVFLQPVYDGTEIKREVLVGPLNKYFTPYDQIPQHFVQSVTTSEDGAFFRHNGFNEDAIREALIENLKAKKFKRGASTISMQFVKNVYLNRKKNLARKFQEIFITWLLENQQPVSKERMMEIYLNIIEFGPDVYGIGEASEFYFRKRPIDLSYEESLFLSGIIPSPKRFFSRFDKEGNLKSSTLETMKFVAYKMKQFDRVESVKVDSLDFGRFSVTGKAKELITPISVAIPDSLEEEN